ncbi:M48 family metallopeptidase [Candidatus Saccharibacteria bacterium]|nr:M48 family metallopeptidase [Candidatus Saccharibacteria bacterium]
MFWRRKSDLTAAKEPKPKGSRPKKEPSMQERLALEKKKAKRKKAEEVLAERCRELAKLHGFPEQKIRLGNMRTRWGSRSSNNTISLNIGLVGLPQPLIDYVILHELTHIRHMNHSKAFYSELAKYDPHYKTHQTALRKHRP